MKKLYNAPRTESQEVMAQMIMQTASPAIPDVSNTGVPGSGDEINWGN
jgi:hypothetical protein